jgi:hypothetical protein
MKNVVTDLRQKQSTATTLVQFAAAIEVVRQFVTVNLLASEFRLRREG